MKNARNKTPIFLLIIDDWGIEPLQATQRDELLGIMDDRQGFTSTAVASQLPSDGWYGSIGDNTLAETILDRLIHYAHRLQLKGESMRKRKKLTQCEHLRQNSENNALRSPVFTMCRNQCSRSPELSNTPEQVPKYPLTRKDESSVRHESRYGSSAFHQFGTWMHS